MGRSALDEALSIGAGALPAELPPRGTLGLWRAPLEQHSLDGELCRGCVVLPGVRQSCVAELAPPADQVTLRAATEPAERGSLDPESRPQPEVAAECPPLVLATPPDLARRGGLASRCGARSRIGTLVLERMKSQVITDRGGLIGPQGSQGRGVQRGIPNCAEPPEICRNRTSGGPSQRYTRIDPASPP